MNIKELVKKAKASVIITERKADVNTLIRTLNRYEDMKIADVGVKTVNEAAMELICAWEASAGRCGKYIYAGKDYASALLYKLIREEKPDFLPETSVCIRTAAEILRVMNIIRLNKHSADFENTADGRAADLKKLCAAYEKRLSEQGYMDDAMLMDRGLQILDEISSEADADKKLCFLLPWLKKDTAIAEVYEIPSKKDDFIKKLLSLSDKDYSSCIIENVQTDKKLTYSFFKGFGCVNEVRFVAEKIREEKLDFGDVAVLYAGDVYENILRAEFENAHIPCIFSSGFHASADPHVGFMLDILEFIENDWSYEALRVAVHDEAFKLKAASKSYRDILREGIGWGKDRYEAFYQRFDKRRQLKRTKEEEEAFEKLSAFVDFMKMTTDIFKSADPGSVLDGLIELTDKYTYDTAVYKKTIREELKAYAKSIKNAGIDDEPVKFLKAYLKELTVAETADPGAVMILSYAGTKIFDRKNAFVLGLTRENLDVTVTESPVLSDAELKAYAIGFIDDAAGRNKRRREHFRRCISESCVDKLWLGYSFYDTFSFLDCAPALLYTELMEEAGVKEEDISRKGYDIQRGAVQLSQTDFYKAWECDAGDNEAEKEETAADDNEASSDENNTAENTEKEYAIPASFSASTIHVLLGCPLRFHYKKHEFLPEEEPLRRSGHSWLGPAQKGNLFHYTMEDYCEGRLIQKETSAPDEDFLKECLEKQTALMLEAIPAPSESIMNEEKEEAFEVMKLYIQKLHNELNNSGRKVLACEAPFCKAGYKRQVEYTPVKDDEAAEDVKAVKADHDMIFSGSIDRVDGYIEDDTLHLLIIDYKTGDYNKKKKEIETNDQIQHFVYPAGAVEWAQNEREYIEKRFGNTFTSVVIDDVIYDFPYERGKEESINTASELDGVDTEIRKGKLCFPDSVEKNITRAEGLYQSSFEGTVEELEKAVSAVISKDGKTADPDKIKEFCKYCDYKKVCRLMLALMAQN